MTSSTSFLNTNIPAWSPAFGSWVAESSAVAGCCASTLGVPAAGMTLAPDVVVGGSGCETCADATEINVRITTLIAKCEQNRLAGELSIGVYPSTLVASIGCKVGKISPGHFCPR